MQSELDAEPVPLSTRRSRWSSAPPPQQSRAREQAGKRSLLSIALIGAVWVAVGAASVAYVVTRSPEARPAVATTDVER
jgi:hypothetical protein